MAVDILDYQGNAGLGLGSNDIPVTTADNAGYQALRGTLRDIMLNNNQKNILEWRQKIADRDKLNQLIAANQVPPGEIEQKDMPYFEQAKKDMEKAYDKWGGNFQDTKGFQDYMQAHQNLENVANHGKARALAFANLRQERNKTEIPERQKKMDEWYAKQKAKPFEDQIDPYQQMYDFNIDPINGFAQTILAKTVKDPNYPFKTDEVSVYDYPTALKNAKTGWLNNRDVANDINEFQDQFQRYDPNQRRGALQALNSQLDRYNDEVGKATIGRKLAEGDKNYAAPVKYSDVGGQVIIQEPVQDFAAKYSLANQSQFVKHTPKFNKDEAKFLLDDADLKRKMLNDARNYGLNKQKTAAYVNHMNAQSKALADKLDNGDVDIQKDYDTLIDKSVAGLNYHSEKTFKNGKVIGQTPYEPKYSPVIFADDLPSGIDMFAAPTLDSKGKVIPGTIPWKTNDSGKKYVDVEYLDPSGNKIDLDDATLKKQYENSQKDHSFNGTFKQYVDYKIDKMKGFLKDPNVGVTLVIKGKDGRPINFSSAYKNARLIQSQNKKKGVSGIYDEVPAPDETQSESE